MPQFRLAYTIRIVFNTRICTAEMAVRYAAICRKVHVCHCNSLGGATWRSVTITGRTDRQTDWQTDGQADRQTDRVRRNMRPPPREDGRIKRHFVARALFDCVWCVSHVCLFYNIIFVVSIIFNSFSQCSTLVRNTVVRAILQAYGKWWV